MKKGDKVVVTDGSYSCEILPGQLELRNSYGADLMRHNPWVVVATNCILPTRDYGYDNIAKNDTIIASNGRIVFIQEKFLRYQICPMCGEVAKWSA